jgi:hypothetical protein
MNLRANFDFSFSQRDILARAAALLEAGEGDRGKQILSALRPAQIGTVQEAIIATEMFLDVHELDAALAAAKRANELDPQHSEAQELLMECRYRIDLPAIWRTESDDIRTRLERLNARASARPLAANAPIHIVCNLESIGGSERRALNLQRLLSAHAPTTLWSTMPPHPAHSRAANIRMIAPGSAPANGTLVLIGTFFPCGNWLQENRFERVVICHNLVGQNQNLVRRLQEIEDNPSHPPVRLTFPSKMFRDLLDLPGTVEYSPVDLAHFLRRQPHSESTSGLAIGRHGRAYAWKFHPNDAAFFRQLLGLGHRVKIIGGSVIAPAFARDSGATPEWIETGALDARDFLQTLDVFVYRKHPLWVETGGSVILEAMAMEVPVVVFPEHCGCAELIVHGENGFLVSTEAEAFAVIERLRADPDLRRRIGSAGRRTLVDLQREHDRETLAYYEIGHAAKQSDERGSVFDEINVLKPAFA